MKGIIQWVRLHFALESSECVYVRRGLEYEGGIKCTKEKQSSFVQTSNNRERPCLDSPLHSLDRLSLLSQQNGHTLFPYGVVPRFLPFARPLKKKKKKIELGEQRICRERKRGGHRNRSKGNQYLSLPRENAAIQNKTKDTTELEEITQRTLTEL